MKNTLFVAATIAALGGTAAAAQELSYQVSGSIGAWQNQNGGADIESNFGLAGTDTRTAAELDFSAAYGFASGYTAVAALGFGAFSDADEELNFDDSTKSTADLTLRVLRDAGAYTFGGFIGSGQHDDDGDSDEDMTYQFAGAEVATDLAFGELFAQVGYLDSTDEYDEGTQDAPFVNFGGSYGFSNGYAVLGSLGFAGGNKYGDEESNNRIINLTLGVERTFGDVAVNASYEATQISYKFDGDDERYGDTFGTLSIGATYAFGGAGDHGSKLPNFGNWVAFNANEIE